MLSKQHVRVMEQDTEDRTGILGGRGKPSEAVTLVNKELEVEEGLVQNLWGPVQKGEPLSEKQERR